MTQKTLVIYIFVYADIYKFIHTYMHTYTLTYSRTHAIGVLFLLYGGGVVSVIYQWIQVKGWLCSVWYLNSA